MDLTPIDRSLNTALASSSLQHFTLPNGLRVWIDSRPQVESITALLVVRVGSRYETTTNNGISHFVEHMVFDGTTRWPTEEEVDDAISHRGGNSNGWTADEITAFYVQLAHSEAKLAVEWLSQIVFHPTFPADKVDKEREIIVQEKVGRNSRFISVLEALGLGYDLDRQIRRAVFPGSALSLRTIGEDASLDRIARDALLDHYHTHYLPANCALIITGRVDVDQLNALVQHYFGAVTATTQIPAAPVTPPLPKRGPQRVTVRGPLPTAESELIIGMRTIEWTHPDRWALEVLAEVMEEALIKAIRFQRGLAYDVHAFTDYFTDTGYFGLTTQCESQHRAEAQRLIEDYFEHVRQGCLTAEQVANAQAALIGGHVLEMEDNLKRAEWLAQWAFAPDGWVFPDFATAIRAVTPGEVQRVLNTYFTPQRRFVGTHQPITTVPQVSHWFGATAGLSAAVWGLRWLWRRIRGPRG